VSPADLRFMYRAVIPGNPTSPNRRIPRFDARNDKDNVSPAEIPLTIR
jgi:hypothetical protein